MSIGFIVAGVVIIAALVGVAIYYLVQVKKMEALKEKQNQELDELKSSHKNYLNNSVQVLAQGIIDEQLSLTEGSIRISVLLDNLKITEEERGEYSALFQLSEATAHIPILDAWKKLSKLEKKKFERERINIEEKYKEFVINAAQQLKGKTF